MPLGDLPPVCLNIYMLLAFLQPHYFFALPFFEYIQPDNHKRVFFEFFNNTF